MNGSTSGGGSVGGTHLSVGAIVGVSFGAVIGFLGVVAGLIACISNW
jgi:hypothetical protein